MQKLDRVCVDVERRRIETKKPWSRKVCDQLAECSDGTQYFLNPTQNMATTAMMLRSILEPSELETKVIYENLHNFVERTAVQQAKINRQFLLGTEKLRSTNGLVLE